MTPTGRLRPTAPSSPAEKAEVALDVLGARVFVDVQIPRTEVAGKMRLVGRDEALQILADVRQFFESKRLPTDPTALASPGVMAEWNNEVAVRHLAIAVRDPSDPNLRDPRPLAPLAEWRLCDDDQISALWEEYQDLRDRLDPLRNFEQLSEQEAAAIASAAKKKPAELDLLMSYGSRKLALFAISTAEPPAS